MKTCPALSLIFALAFSGCGGSDAYSGAVGSLKGKVSVGGTPLPPGATIVMLHNESGYTTSARIGQGGEYAFGDIRVGKYSVGITPAENASTLAEQDPDALMARIEDGTYEEPEADAQIPPEMQSPESSGLTTEVAEGSHEFDLNL